MKKIRIVKRKVPELVEENLKRLGSASEALRHGAGSGHVGTNKKGER